MSVCVCQPGQTRFTIGITNLIHDSHVARRTSKLELCSRRSSNTVWWFLHVPASVLVLGDFLLHTDN